MRNFMIKNSVYTVKRYGAVFAAAWLVTLSGCVSVHRTANIQRTEDVREEIEEHILGPDDVVYISVLHHPEWEGQFRIDQKGMILIPQVGEIKLKGLIKEVAAELVAERLGRFISRPEVTLAVISYESQWVYVLGEVARPGRHITGGKDLTLKDAVVMAGLPTRFAATRQVYVITPSEENPRQQVINLHRILNRGETRMNVDLEPGDIVYVPKTFLGRISDLLSAILSPLTDATSAARTVGSPVP